MSRGYAVRAAMLAILGIIVSGCVGQREMPDPGPSGCPLNELPLASFIEEVNRCASGPIAVASATDTGNPQLGGSLCICTSSNVAFALRWLGIEADDVSRIPLAQAGHRTQRALQQESQK